MREESKMAVKAFNTLMGYLRLRGSKMETGEFRALLLIVTAIYGAVALVIIGAAANLSVKRAWERAIAPPPRRRSK
jgi:hypothetical protein